MSDAKKCYIYTRSGVKFFPLLPDAELINIEDIAHSLSNICRFTGHVKSFYSVAQHSVYVSGDVPRRLALAGLLHDASEAYLCDVSAPVKKLDSMSSYREVEEALQNVIYKKFGIDLLYDSPAYKGVKEADERVYRLEVAHLMPYTEVGPVASSVLTFEPWSPEKARDEFLKRYDILTKTKAARRLAGERAAQKGA